MQGQQVRDEDVSTPSADHVSIEQRTETCPHDAPLFDRLDPQIEREDQQKDSDGLVIVAPCHRSRNVSRRDAHEDRSEKPGGWGVAHLGGEKVGGEGCEAGEAGCEQDADVANVDGEGEEAEDFVDDAGGDHQAGVEGPAGDAAEGVPCSCDALLARPMP